MRRALLELLLIGAVGGVVGCWIVLYRLAYSTESLAHALFPGLVVAALAGLPLLVGGAVGLLVATVAVAVVGRAGLIGRDASVAVVVTTLFGLGVLLALSRSTPPGLDRLLFGDLLGVTVRDLTTSGALTACALVGVFALHRSLLVAGFDRGSAAAFGVRPLLVDVALLALVATAILIGVQALGNLLVVALFLGPPASARLLTRRLPSMMIVAVVVAAVSSIVGLYVSYYADLAAGASVVIAVLVAYLLAAVAGAIPRGKTSNFPRN